MRRAGVEEVQRCTGRLGVRRRSFRGVTCLVRGERRRVQQLSTHRRIGNECLQVIDNDVVVIEDDGCCIVVLAMDVDIVRVELTSTQAIG